MKVNVANLTAILSAFCLPSPASAHLVQFVISGTTQAKSGDWTTVELLLLNNSTADQSMTLPDNVEGVITSNEIHSIQLERAPSEPITISVPAHGFARTRYRAIVPVGSVQGNDLISIPEWSTQKVALPLSPVISQNKHAAAENDRSEGPEIASRETEESREDVSSSNLFRNLSAHEPIYAILGSVAQSELQIQGSFKYKLLGSSSPESRLHPWHYGLYFAFTQKMFWNLASDSSFRDINYSPELFYRTPWIRLKDNLEGGIQAGIQHESNGRAGTESRSVNNIYIAPTAMWNLGSGYNLTLSPRLSMLIGGHADNPDIRSYRGITGLKVQIGQVNGLRLSASGRLNFSTGRGALLTELSYPLPRLLGGGPELYLFGQNFVGYGENLLDYNRHVTRFRAGLAIVR